MPRTEEFDWIFDYSLQFLESEKFDAALMDFVDEKCLVFEDEDENKLIYTDIHREFCDHVEALISSNLAELGITTELFLESCDKARNGRDINVNVFERLMAMEDFQTFKKLMTKRNIELQLESIRSFKVNTPMPASKVARHSPSKRKDGPGSDAKGIDSVADGKEDDKGHGEDDYDVDAKNGDSFGNTRELTAFEREELEALQSYALATGELDQLSDEDIQELLFQSLVEMELLHRQEELEHAEIERALLMSLAVEEERLSAMAAELEDLHISATSMMASKTAEPKSSPKATFGDKSEAPQEKPREAKATSFAPSTSATTSSSSSSASPVRSLAPIGGELPPLRFKGDLKPLPSINPLNALNALSEKKKQAEDALKRSAQQLQQQRQKEEELRAQVLDADEAQRRAQHMQRQRELLLEKKKAERDEKVRLEAEAKHKRDAKGGDKSDSDAPSAATLASMSADAAQGGAKMTASEEEARRNALRQALARRLKMDVTADQEAKSAAQQEAQFAALDQRLQQVEALREENRRKEIAMQRAVERQKEQIARNMELSAAALQQGR